MRGVLVVLGFMLLSTVMHAQHMHPTGPAADWYEDNCCHNQDCKPVKEGVVEDKLRGVEVHGYAKDGGDEMLSYGDSRLRWSRDDQDHVCASRVFDTTKGTSGYNLRCVYRRFKGT